MNVQCVKGIFRANPVQIVIAESQDNHTMVLLLQSIVMDHFAVPIFVTSWLTFTGFYDSPTLLRS